MTAHFPRPPFPAQKQSMPGSTAKMNPRPDHGESSYKGSGKLLGKRAIITGGDSGIGRAVAIAFAREGADLLIAYLNEDEDAREVQALIEKARKGSRGSAPRHRRVFWRGMFDRTAQASGSGSYHERLHDHASWEE
jgi:hypothetical protein